MFKRRRAKHQNPPVEKPSDPARVLPHEDETTGSEGTGRLVGLNPDEQAGEPGTGKSRPAHPEPRDKPRLVDEED